MKRIRQLQGDGTLKDHIPVIAVTANVRQQQILIAMDAGMDDVVSKPFRVPGLLDRMKALMHFAALGFSANTECIRKLMNILLMTWPKC